MNVMIVGATGYIGSKLLIAARSLGPTAGTATRGGDLLQLNLMTPDQFDYDQVGPRDLVVITAAISAPDVCAREPARARAVNVEGTSFFCNTIISRGARIIFLSSDTVYGERADTFDESAIANPAGDYAKMKFEVEHRFLGHPAFKSVRLSYVFSRHDKLTEYLVKCSENGDEAELFHPFNRAVVSIDDVVDGVLGLAHRWNSFPQPIFNFAGPAIVSRIEIAEALKAWALPGLRYRQVEPAPAFFLHRPRVISMTSRYFSLLLGRRVRSLPESVAIAFALKGQK